MTNNSANLSSETYSTAQRLARSASVLTLAALMAACATSGPTPVSDGRFGDAVRAARMAQTINPNASANRTRPMGLDGKAANSVMENYQKSFSSPKTTFDIATDSGSSSN